MIPGFSNIGLGAGMKGERSKNERKDEEMKLNRKTTEAILRKTVQVSLRSFHVEITMDQAVIDDALKIHEAESPHSLLRCIESFQSNYDQILYTGSWIAGGSLEVTARTTNAEKKTFGALLDYTSNKTNMALTLGLEAPAYAPVLGNFGLGRNNLENVRYNILLKL